MNHMKIFYPEYKFGGFTHIDGTIAFYIRVNALLQPHFTVMDVGCGRGIFSEDNVAIRKQLCILQGKCKKVIGIDVDPAAIENPYLDEFHLIESNNWPIPDNSVDLLVGDFVLEHVPHPPSFFSECNRVLRLGGYVCLRTPNSWGYVALMSRLIPNRLHKKILQLVQPSRKNEDIFPTLYKSNTTFSIRRMFSENGFDHSIYTVESEPSYLSFSKTVYYLGVVFSPFIPRVFRNCIFAFGRKTSSKL